jgi:hypothetical protein
MTVLKILNISKKQTFLEKHERVQKLFETLNDLKASFLCAEDAHAHIAAELRKIENQYASPRNSMGMLKLVKFNFSKKTDIFFSQMNEHCVLINTNGAYAIYRSSYVAYTNNQFNWEWYKENSKKLVEFPNKNDDSLWCNIK